MLNYIWAAFIILGIGYALYLDVDRQILAENNSITVNLVSNSDQNSNKLISINNNALNKIFKTSLNDSLIYSYSSIGIRDKVEKIRININKDDKTILKDISKILDDGTGLNCELIENNNSYQIKISGIGYLTLKKITSTLFDYAKIAVEIALGLIGIMALWLGVLKISEMAGLIKIIGNLIKPLTKFLFPQVPQDHPAIGSIIMNISANMLGLGNAATPFGLKAMDELQTLNDKKDTASNAMCMFLAINTAGLTLIPATCIAIRSTLGSTNPTIIIGTTIFAAFIATLTGIFVAKVFEFIGSKTRSKKDLYNFLIIPALIILLGLSFYIINNKFKLNINFEYIFGVINYVSAFIIPLIVIIFIAWGLVKKIKVYETFIEGAKEGFNMAVRIIPYLVGMLFAIGILRSSGVLSLFIDIVSPLTNLIGLPAESLPMAFMRPLSGSGSMGIMTEIMQQHGPDSFLGILVSTFFGSTETTFYVLAVYFGAVNIKKIRHSVVAGVIADIAGILAALFIVNQLFG